MPLLFSNVLLTVAAVILDALFYAPQSLHRLPAWIPPLAQLWEELFCFFHTMVPPPAPPPTTCTEKCHMRCSLRHAGLRPSLWVELLWCTAKMPWLAGDSLGSFPPGLFMRRHPRHGPWQPMSSTSPPFSPAVVWIPNNLEICFRLYCFSPFAAAVTADDGLGI